MHILYIHQYFTTPSAGGGTRSYEFAKRFVAAGHQVTMLTGTDIQKLPADAQIPGLRIISTRTRYGNEMSPRQRKIQFIKFALTACFQRIDPFDVILATSTPLTVAIPGLWYKFTRRRPLIFEVRDLWPEAPIQMGVIHNPLFIWALRVFERVIYRFSNHIVALSEGMAQGIRNTGVRPEKITVIPNSSDFDLFRAGPIEDSFLRKQNLPLRPTVCYAGSLGDVNEIPILLEAVRILRDKKSPIQIVIAGEGKHRSSVEEAVRRNPNSNLIYLGPTSKQGVAEIYRSCHAGLMLVKPLPVLQTNSSNKFFDLLAAGRPLVTDVRGWIGDLIAEHKLGFLVESTPESFAAGIEAAVANLDFTGMSKRGESLARDQFDRDLLATRYLDVLHKVRST
jgi:glycosyltransferase involved in cell wall biosynthesis